MKLSFLNHEKPLLVVLFEAQTPEIALDIVERSNAGGAEAFCFQVCKLLSEYQNSENYRKVFAAMGNRPVYVTNYRCGINSKQPDEIIAEGLIKLANCGATLCDVMGDMYDKQPGEITMNPIAVKKQKILIEQLHQAGAEVLMSSHIKEFMSAEGVLEIALAQQDRGADIVKIVTHAENMEQQIENLRITNLLKKELKVPFLFLSNGECKLHRRVGAMLGCCMYLCSLDYNLSSPAIQPQLWKAKAIRDGYDW